MKQYFGNYLGIVIDNNDPEHRGRVQVFIPHIMPTLYEGWNKKGENITLKCVADNTPDGLTSDIVEKLKKILPWSEAASPIIGQSGPGGVSGGLAAAMSSGSPESLGGDATGGAAAAAGAPGAAPGAGGAYIDQSPTGGPAGALVPGEPFAIPKTGSHIDVVNLKPIFVQRVNAFYKEALTLGYKIQCTSAFRSYEKQAALFKKIGRGGCAPPGNSTHETGIAVDLYITGPGVSITSLSVASSRSGKNYDNPQFWALLAKYNLHQPLHPRHGASAPEHWHIEPIEMPAAKKGDRSGPVSLAVAKQMSVASQNQVAETTSSSQLPAAASPLADSKPQNTSMGPPIAPSTT